MKYTYFARPLGFWLANGVVVAILNAQPIYADRYVGAKTSRQFFASLEVTTGVPLTDPEVQKIMMESKERLPRHGNLDELNAPGLYAVMAAADVVCKKWIHNESNLPREKRKVHSEVEFTGSPANLDSPTRQLLRQKYAENFWQRSIGAEEDEALKAALDESIALHSANNGTVEKALRPLCISTISSLAFLTN